MNNTFNIHNTIGVIGAGSFGTVIANITAQNVEQVLMYVRSEKRLNNFNVLRKNNDYDIAENITATQSYQEIATKCNIILAMVPSSSFRKMMQDLSPFLRPDHIIIHGTKGVDVDTSLDELKKTRTLKRKQIHTMSEVILQESVVRRIGCIAGPNLSKEIAQNQPAGAIIASEFEEVINVGTHILNTQRFKIFRSHDLLGAEFTGVLKNIFAIASGILEGLGFGNNARALLITRGLHEMIHLGNQLGGDTSAFLGIAGIGDLVATCSSPLSRNFSVGKRIALGEDLQTIMKRTNEVAEGIRSIKIFHHFAQTNHIAVPITNMLYKIAYQQKDALEALRHLMGSSYAADVNFL